MWKCLADITLFEGPHTWLLMNIFMYGRIQCAIQFQSLYSLFGKKESRTCHMTVVQHFTINYVLLLSVMKIVSEMISPLYRRSQLADRSKPLKFYVALLYFCCIIDIHDHIKYHWPSLQMNTLMCIKSCLYHHWNSLDHGSLDEILILPHNFKALLNIIPKRSRNVCALTSTIL